MLSVVWIYERPDNSVPFFSEAPEFSEDQKILDDMISKSGYVVSYEKQIRNEGLTQVATVIYNSVEDYQAQLDLNNERIPLHSIHRINYVLENDHRMMATASENIFVQPDGSFSNTFKIGIY